MFRPRLSTLALCLLGLFTAFAAGCHRGRVVYQVQRGEVYSDMSATDLKNTAAELGETYITNGEGWQLNREASNMVRVTHTVPRHLTYIDIYFYEDGDGSTYAANGYSRAMGGRWTFGISDTATQGVARPKIEAFLEELNVRSGGAQ